MTIRSFINFFVRKVTTAKPLVLRNVFHSEHKKKALLSYIQEVFTDLQLKNDLAHTNRLTTYIIGELLHEAGFQVDVVSWHETPVANYSEYQLVIGLGKTIDDVIAGREKKKPFVIWFGTGCNPLFSNVVTLQRVQDFYERSGKLLLSSSRYIKEDWPLQHEFSDWIILHGQQFARETYTHKNISCIHAPVFIHHKVERSSADWRNAKKNFLWFGNAGLIHKGLDLTIEAFLQDESNCLHICGNLEGEPDFLKYYNEKISNRKNIFCHGFVDVKSQNFAAILKSCAFVIFPSASEGNSPSVITCMANGGLVPLVTKNADVTSEGDEIIIGDLKVDAVKEAVRKASLLTPEEIEARSERIIKRTASLNSFEYFRQDFKNQLALALKTQQPS